jgi:hypothetical protein
MCPAEGGARVCRLGLIARQELARRSVIVFAHLDDRISQRTELPSKTFG